MEKDREKEKGLKRTGNENQRNNGQRKEFSKECWQCGKMGHFCFECPESKGNSV